MNKLFILLIAFALFQISSAWGEGWGEGNGWRGEGWRGEGWRGEGWRGEGWNRPWGRPWGFNTWGWRRNWKRAESPKETIEDDSVSLKAVADVQDVQLAECKFFSEKSKFVCNGAVECDVMSRMSDFHPMFEMFGIGVPDRVEKQMKFRLYPKNLTDVTYLSCVFDKSSGKFVELSLFYGEESMQEYGLVFKEKSCYERVVEYFKSFKDDVSVESVNEKKTVFKVSLLGYVLYA